ncbi:MAG TPA: hypothetical protein VMM78_06095 [Thermomicrobiales bacterium]|nr:hypothetical protein [Thermomicrobiales bacterium]
MCALPLVAGAQSSGLDPFQSTWARTDKPVNDGVIVRTWMWGLQTDAYPTVEPYVEGVEGERHVVYFDKSRMEITDPSEDQTDPWFVTNGLLVVELVSGEMQVGDEAFETRSPAHVNVAGDVGDPHGPTYATFSGLMAPYSGSQPTTLSQTVDRAGNVSTDSRFTAYDVGTARWVDETQHWVAAPFWEFMNSEGIIWIEGDLAVDDLFPDPFYATGFPITEAYWTRVLLKDIPTDVLVQCFERRCLTYTPDNPAGWKVEAGNVGLHYYIWRYGEAPPKTVG